MEKVNIVRYGKHSSEHCTLLEWNDMKIVVDCGYDINRICTYLTDRIPSKKTVGEERIQGYSYQHSPIIYHVDYIDQIDWQTIDFICISHLRGLFCLPWVTEYTPFKGRILATEPILYYGKVYLEYLLELHLEGGGYPQESLPFRSFYSNRDIAACMHKLSGVHYQEMVPLLGDYSAQAMSAGTMIGASIWLFANHSYKMVVITDMSMKMMNPTLPLHTYPLIHSDCMVLSSTIHATFKVDDSIRGFFSVVERGIHHNGNVVVPCDPLGVFMNVLLMLLRRIAKHGLKIKVIVMGSAFQKMLKISGVMGEWVSTSYQDKVLSGEPLFPFDQFIRTEALIFADGFHDRRFIKGFKEPAVVFCGHPSLRMGPVLEFIQMWRHDPKHCIVMIDPGIEVERCVGPFRDMSMGIYSFPMDASLASTEITQFIQQTAPKQIYLAPHTYQGFHDVGIGGVLLGDADPIAVVLGKGYVRASLAGELVMKLGHENMKRGRDGQFIGGLPLKAQVSGREGEYQLWKSITEPFEDRQGKVGGMAGSSVLRMQNLYETLYLAGFHTITFEEGGEHSLFSVYIDEPAAILTVYPDMNVSVSSTNDRVKQRILDALRISQD